MLNVTNILEKLGGMIVRESKSRMNLPQVGVDGNGYAELAASTKRRKAALRPGTEKTRMIFTKDFQNNAFQFSVKGNTLLVFISDDLHGAEIKSLSKTIDKHNSILGMIGHGDAKQRSKSLKTVKSATGDLLHAIDRSATYSQIAEYQNIGGRSKFFPTTIEEINNQDSVKKIIPILEKECGKQMKAELAKRLRSIIRA